MTESAKKHHIFSESSSFTEDDAINTSALRDESITLNTVFAQPFEMLECETDDPVNPTLIISEDKVQAYQCTKILTGQWLSENVGMVHAIFSSDGNHFPGEQYLHKNVIFPKNFS